MKIPQGEDISQQLSGEVKKEIRVLPLPQGSATPVLKGQCLATFRCISGQTQLNQMAVIPIPIPPIELAI